LGKKGLISGATVYSTRQIFICLHLLQNRNDGTEFGGSIYQKVNNKVETSVNLAWTAGSNNTRFGIAAKYQLDEKTSIGVRMFIKEEVFQVLLNAQN